MSVLKVNTISHFAAKSASYLNSLWHSDAIWRHRSGPTMVQVMPCYLKVLRHSPGSNFSRSSQELHPKHVFGDCIFLINTFWFFIFAKDSRDNFNQTYSKHWKGSPEAKDLQRCKIKYVSMNLLFHIWCINSHPCITHSFNVVYISLILSCICVLAEISHASWFQL